MVDKTNSKEGTPNSPFLEGEFSESPFLEAFVFEPGSPEPSPEPELEEGEYEEVYDAEFEDHEYEEEDEYEYDEKDEFEDEYEEDEYEEDENDEDENDEDDEAYENEMEEESGYEAGIDEEARGGGAGSAGVSPLAIPALRGWSKKKYRPKSWRGKVYGLVVHTTGSGVPRRAADEGIEPSAWAVRYYKRSRGCHYVNGWNGIDGGDLFQVANENVQARGVGVTNKSQPKKDQRRSISRGRFEKDLPAVLVRLWKERWPGKKNSLELLPGTKTANSCYIHMECPPCVYWYNGKKVTGEPPMKPGLRFTKAQHDSVARMAVDIARRNGWPMEEKWWRTPRLLGHEDLTPISRHNKSGGWDPGYLREEPYFDWDYVYETIETLVKKEQGGWSPRDIAEPAISIFSGLGSMAKRFLALMFSGDENRAVSLAYQQGERDENKLTNMVFFARHPELGGRKLKSHEKELVREWLDIRNRLVKPVLQGEQDEEIDEEMLEESELAEFLVEDSEEETGEFLDETGFEHHHHEPDEEWGPEDEEFRDEDEYEDEDENEDEYEDEFEDEFDDEMEEVEDEPYMAEEESSGNYVEGPGEDIDLARAVRLNRHYARKVGWFRRRDEIARFLGFTASSPDDRALAVAVAGWQEQNGLGADGIIGPNTWKRLQAALKTQKGQDIDLARAVRLNRSYGKKLGWLSRQDSIARFLGFTDYSPDEETFARAVADWQQKQGFEVDGVIGPKTWSRIRRAIGAGHAPTDSPKPKKSGKVRISSSVLARIAQYDDIIDQIAKEEGIDGNWIRGVIAAESGGKAHSGKGSTGYKGLMQAYRDKDKKGNQLDPETSIRSGAKKLKRFRTSVSRTLRQNGIDPGTLDTEMMIRLTMVAYNAGPATLKTAMQYAFNAGNVKRWEEPENFQRALIFYGAYSERVALKSCLEGPYGDTILAEFGAILGMSADEVRDKYFTKRGWNRKGLWKALKKADIYQKKKQWKDDDDLTMERARRLVPRWILCSVKFKHGNLRRWYLDRIIGYMRHYMG